MTKKLFSSRKPVICLSIVLVLILLLLLLTTGNTQLWFYESESVSATSEMGNIAVSLQTQGETPLDSTMEYQTIPFIIENHSTINTYMRMGYTLILRDESGEQLPLKIDKDSFYVSIPSLLIDGGNLPLSDSSVRPITTDLYSKNMITFFENTSNSLYEFPFHTRQISGNLTVQLNSLEELVHAIPDGAQLYFVCTPEAIQATDKALEEFRPYGWQNT